MPSTSARGCSLAAGSTMGLDGTMGDTAVLGGASENDGLEAVTGLSFSFSFSLSAGRRNELLTDGLEGEEVVEEEEVVAEARGS